MSLFLKDVKDLFGCSCGENIKKLQKRVEILAFPIQWWGFLNSGEPAPCLPTPGAKSCPSGASRGSSPGAEDALPGRVSTLSQPEDAAAARE